MRFFVFRRIFFVFSCLALLGTQALGAVSIPTTPEENAWLAEHRRVRVRLADWPPYTMVKPAPAGVSVDYLAIIADRLGLELDFVTTPVDWPDAVEDLRGPRRHYDLLPHLNRTPEREGFLALTDNYLAAPWVIYTRDDSPYIAGVESLAGTRVAAEEGFVITNKLRSDYPQLDILEVNETLDGLRAVATGLADAYVGNLAIANFLIKSNRLSNLVVAAPTGYGLHTQAMGVRKDWPELASLINKVLASMTSEEVSAINEKWGAVKFEPRTDYRLVWQITTGALLVLLAIGYWNRRLVGEIRARKITEANLKRSESTLTANQSRLLEAQESLRLLNQTLEEQVSRRTAELAKATREAEAANQAKSQFLAQMSHEIRTPMNSVLGMAQVLERTRLSSDQHAMVEQINNAGRSLLGIIDDILDLSRIEAGRLDLLPSRFELGPLLSDATRLLTREAAVKGLSLTLGALPDLDGALVGDAMRLRQILINLLANAIKFTESGAVSLRVRAMEVTPEQAWLRFEVRDTGIGIAPDVLSRLFAPFEQADAGMHRAYGGAGLGLSICKQLVELMDGAIGADSQPGEGSLFWVQLRLARTKVPVQPESPMPLASGQQRLAGLRLVVADDNPGNRQVIKHMLTGEGARVTLLENGRQTVDLLRAQQDAIDALLIDVQMPVMDGLTATRIIRAEPNLGGLPIIALTAGVLPEQQPAIWEAGVSAVLFKPVDLEQLVSTLIQLSPDESVPGASGDLVIQPAGAVTESGLSYPEIAGIDSCRAARNTNQDLPLFLDMLAFFLNEYGADGSARIRQALARGDRKSAAFRLHALRNSAGNIAATAITELARGLEESVERGATGLDDDLAELERQLQALSAASAPHVVANVMPDG